MTPFTCNVAHPFCLYSELKTPCQNTGSLNFGICVGMMVHVWVGSVYRGLVANCWFVRAGIFLTKACCCGDNNERSSM